MELRTIMKDLKHLITERTTDLGTEDYIWFMRELGDWVSGQAEAADFRVESFNEMENQQNEMI